MTNDKRVNASPVWLWIWILCSCIYYSLISCLAEIFKGQGQNLNVFLIGVIRSFWGKKLLGYAEDKCWHLDLKARFDFESSRIFIYWAKIMYTIDPVPFLLSFSLLFLTEVCLFISKHNVWSTGTRMLLAITPACFRTITSFVDCLHQIEETKALFTRVEIVHLVLCSKNNNKTSQSLMTK